MGRIELFKNDVMDYVITGTPANTDIDIWIKFISYFKKSEIEFLEKCQKKNIENMSVAEIEMLTKLSKQKKLADLFKKYKDRKCSKDEHDAVKLFMYDNKLDEFVYNRMTEEERTKATKIVSNLTKTELIEYIDANNDNYESLDIFAAYVLFIAKEKLYEIQKMEFIENEMNRQKEETFRLHKSLLRDYGPKF